MIAHRRPMRKFLAQARGESRRRELREKTSSERRSLKSLFSRHDPVIQPGRNVVYLSHRLGRDARVTDVDQGVDLGEGVLNFANDSEVELWHSAQPGLKIDEQIRLMQQLGALRG